MHLLSLEWKKFRKNSVVTLLTCFYFLFLPAASFIGKNLKTDGISPLIPGSDTYYSFPGVWEYLGYAGNWVVFFFLGVVAIYLVTAEVNYKTQRQSIINGMTRESYFLSKLYAILTISFIATIYYVIIALILGVINTEQYDFGYMFENNWAIPRYFLMSVGYLSFAMLLAYLLKKSGLAIFVYFSYVMIIELILRWVIHSKFFEGGSAKYYPLNAIEDLMPLPLWKIGKNFKMSDIDYNPLLSYTEAAGISIVSIIAFITISWFVFKKSDI